MAEEADNPVLQHLRFIRERVDTLHEPQLEILQRMGNLELQMANLGTQMAGLSVRVDRLDARLDRVEQRLGLIEA